MGERGNSALRVACDAMLLVDDSDHHQGVLQSCTKQKEAPPFESYVIRRRVVDLGRDTDGEPVTSCVLEPQDAVRTAYQLLPKKDKERRETLWEKFGANPFGCNEGATYVGWTSGGASRAFRRWHQPGLLDAREGRYRGSAASRAVLER